MAFDQKYYDDQKAKVQKRFEGIKDSFINKMINVVNEFQTTWNEMNLDMADIVERETKAKADAEPKEGEQLKTEEKKPEETKK